MNNVTKQINIEVYSPMIHTIHAQQGDNKTRIVEFFLYDQGKPYIIPDNISITMEGHRGDNSSFWSDDICTVKGRNIITAALDSDILYAAGTVEAKIVLYDDENVLSTVPFRIHVQKNPCDKKDIETKEKSIVESLMQSLNDLKQKFLNHLSDVTKHIPGGGSTGQILKWNNGTAIWENEDKSILNDLYKIYALKSIYGDDEINLGREEGTKVGSHSCTEGYNNVASNNNSHAEGGFNTASGYSSHAEGQSNTASGYAAHAEGYQTKAEGDHSHVEGFKSTAGGINSHAEGYNNEASKNCAHAEGMFTTASGLESHAEGYHTMASGECSHAEGDRTTASGDGAHAEGTYIIEGDVLRSSIAKGKGSHAEGIGTIAGAIASHAEGYKTSTSEDQGSAHAEGYETNALGQASHAEGRGTTAFGNASHAEGYHNLANGTYSHVEGSNNEARGAQSHVEGTDNIAIGASSHASGYFVTASKFLQFVIGSCNTDNTYGDDGIVNENTNAFIIGNGNCGDDSDGNIIPTNLSNAFSVQRNGIVKASGTVTASTAADYAEFFEWSDGNHKNEDRVGKFVTIDGENIRIANDKDDYILGIVSGRPCILGNGDCDTWNGMYLKDEFGRDILEPTPKIEEVEVTEEIEEEVPVTNEETGETVMTKVKRTVVTGTKFQVAHDENGNIIYEGTRLKLNPEYDSTRKYVSRFDRPEWSPVGMLGVLSVYDDGTCDVNGYCKCNKDGIATKSDSGYRVVKRVSDNIIKVIFK